MADAVKGTDLATWRKKGDVHGKVTYLGNVTGTAASSYADIAGYSRVTVVAVNGASNSCVWDIQVAAHASTPADPQSSPDTTYFEDATYRLNYAATLTAAGTDITTTAAAVDHISLDPTAYARFVRANVGTGNANGTDFYVYAET